MTETVTYQLRDGVALLLIDRPPVNAIDVSIRAGLIAGIARAEADAGAQAVLIACAGRTFLSGADLAELSVPIQSPGYYEALARIEACAKPVIAVLHGTALGGGLETALACHYRAAVTDARMGLPEITLGIIPGAGATQRLPRLIGAMKTFELMIAGAPIGAEEAKAIGLIDEIVAGDPVEGGFAYVKALIREARSAATYGRNSSPCGWFLLRKRECRDGGKRARAARTHDAICGRKKSCRPRWTRRPWRTG